MNGEPPPVPPSIPPVSPPSKTSGLAIASLVLGILGITCLLPILGPILAIVLGIVALNQIGKSRGCVAGQGRAIAGLILGGVGLLIIPILAAMLLPALASAREKARRVQCMNNLKIIGMAIDFYAEEHKGIVPRKFDDLWRYTSNLDNLLICPSAKDKSKPSYEITLGGREWKSIDLVDSVVVLESASDHRSGRYALYGDGHVQFIFNERDSP
jgi:type II secretory pathway pseudopilin PulG